uniref:Uncharacterized protein n=1 Tax=Caenorhabditis japonica TaxID=281687 RepID=A0A8R1ERC0_CAEJA
MDLTPAERKTVYDLPWITSGDLEIDNEGRRRLPSRSHQKERMFIDKPKYPNNELYPLLEEQRHHHNFKPGERLYHFFQQEHHYLANRYKFKFGKKRPQHHVSLLIAAVTTDHENTASKFREEQNEEVPTSRAIAKAT